MPRTPPAVTKSKDVPRSSGPLTQSSTRRSSSSLHRAMRYAEPWLDAGGPALLLTPALLLCACADRGHSGGACRKCGGARLPGYPSHDGKFGTVRCYPSSPPILGSSPLRAGTVRVSSSSRPSILPDFQRSMRHSKDYEDGTLSRRTYSSKGTITSGGTLGRKSILECDINPYELMAASGGGLERKDTSITFVNGQRIRVRPTLPFQREYEKVQVKKNETMKINLETNKTSQSVRVKSPPKRSMTPNNPNFKSILKKSPSPYENMDSSKLGGTVRLKKDAQLTLRQNKKGSQFYLPTPSRKKVQFLVDNNDENEYEDTDENCDNINVYDDVENRAQIEDEQIKEDNQKEEPQKVAKRQNGKVAKLQRSNSDRVLSDQHRATFFDTMALRHRKKSDSIVTLADKDPERLDGLTSTRNRKLSPNKPRPTVPPPPPPKNEDQTEEIAETSTQDESDVKETRVPNKITSILDTDDAINNKPANVVRESVLENNKAEPSAKSAIISDIPPSAPPRKRSGNKPPIQIENSIPEVRKVTIESTPKSNNNRTVLQINGTSPVHKIQIKNEFPDTPTTVNISVVDTPQRKTSILINGDDCYSTVNVNDDVPMYQSSVVVSDSPTSTISKSSSKIYVNAQCNEQEIEKDSKPSSALLMELLSDPVEAVRRNLVPHVCGKAEVSRRPKPFSSHLLSGSLLESPLEDDKYDDVGSEHSSSTPYELMDPGSDCYTDHSNRSSVTEDELANRTKFYELLAEAAAQIEVADGEEHHYESIKASSDPIYEEIEIPPPLPANPPPPTLLDDLKLDKEYTTRSIFEGASKYDILSYLVDAKERGVVQEDGYGYTSNSTNEDEAKVSDSSEENSLVMSGVLMDDKATCQKAAEVERNDSGVGSETSKSSLSKYRVKPEVTILCEDCDGSIESNESEPLICRKCLKKRAERKEIIMEIVETEEKYGKDLQIILEEFFRPMLVAGLLTPEQLNAIFLNVEELLENSQALAERLRDAVEIAQEQGDDDLLTVDIGRIFSEAASILHAFEVYCVRQSAAALLLASLEKDKELLRIFLRVSQMENTLLRRMNLNSFLMVPVQRVTKYPLLLARLHKSTPTHQASTRERLREAQRQVEARLAHMNAAAKDAPAARLWRRIGGGGRRPSTEVDLASIKLRKLAVDALEWNHEEARFALEGRLLFTQPADNGWRRGRTIKLAPVAALLVVQGGPSRSWKNVNAQNLAFPRSSGARDAALLLVRDKGGRHSLLREPLFLDRCVIATDPAWRAYFEVHELVTRDTFIFKAEDDEQTHTWYRQLQFYAQGMGAWRKRRNALANIMINGMGLRT